MSNQLDQDQSRWEQDKTGSAAETLGNIPDDVYEKCKQCKHIYVCLRHGGSMPCYGLKRFEPRKQDDVAKLTSERDALLSALIEIVREAFDCDVEGEEYCSHDTVQNMIVSLLLQHGRMRVSEKTKGWFKFND